MGVGDVLLDLDLQTGRYGLVPADALWNSFYGVRRPGSRRRRRSARRPNRTSVAGNVARPPLPHGAAAGGAPRRASDRHRARQVGRRPARRRRRRRRPREPRERRAARSAAPGALLADVRTRARHVCATCRPARRWSSPTRTGSGPYWATSLTKSYGATEQADETAAREEPVRPAARRVPRRDDEVADGHDPARREVGAGDAGLPGVQPDGHPSVARARRQHLHRLVGRRRRAVGREGATAHRLREADHDRRAQHRAAARRRKPGPVDHPRPADVRRRAPRGAHARRVVANVRRRRRCSFPKRTFSSVEIRIDGTHHTKGTPVRRGGLPGDPHRRRRRRTRRRSTCRRSRACRSISSRRSVPTSDRRIR